MPCTANERKGHSFALSPFVHSAISIASISRYDFRRSSPPLNFPVKSVKNSIRCHYRGIRRFSNDFSPLLFFFLPSTIPIQFFVRAEKEGRKLVNRRTKSYPETKNMFSAKERKGEPSKTCRNYD